MLMRVKSRTWRADRTLAEVPPGTRIYAVGDIHGSIEPLRHLHHLIQEDARRHRAARKLVVYLGDYIDRGMNPRGVIDLLLKEPLHGLKQVFLMGNHEAGLLRFLYNGSMGLAWLAYGGVSTVYSYGVRPPTAPADDGELRRVRRELARKIPRTHVEFLAQLEPLHVEGDYVFVHAGLRPGIPLEQQSVRDLLWIRNEFLHCEEHFGKVVIHGHSITAIPDIRHNRIGIDTGAFASGRLTCLVLEGTRQEFIVT